MNLDWVWGVVTLGTALWDLRDHRCTSHQWHAYYAGLCGGIAIWEMLAQNPPGFMLYGAATAIEAWIWWKKRPPRKRRPSKTLATIRDLGHRLVVAS